MFGAFAYILGNSRKNRGKLSDPGDRFLKTRKEQTESQLFSHFDSPTLSCALLCSLVPSSVNQLASPPSNPFDTKQKQVSGPVCHWEADLRTSGSHSLHFWACFPVSKVV